MDSLTNIGHPHQLLQRIAEQSSTLIASAEGVLVGLVREGSSILFMSGAGYLKSQVGSTQTIEGSLSGLAVTTGRIVRSDNTEMDPRVDLEACRRYRVVSTICIPMRRGAVTLGVLCVSSSKANAFDEADEACLREIAEFTSTVVGAASDLSNATAILLEGNRPDPGERHDKPGRAQGDDHDALERFVANVLDLRSMEDLTSREAVEDVLRARSFEFAFQPIFDLESGQLAMVEALARFTHVPRQPPDVWFAAAARVGLGVDLELAAVETALDSLSALPVPTRLSINVGPHATASERFPDLVRRADTGRVVIELTEQVRVDDYPALRVALMDLRRDGVTLAIDDAGAGYASLSHILKLAPDFIKLDLTLTQGIDVDPVRRALATALVNFAQETGARIISEGIETEDELLTLRELGVHYGQGYLLGRPGPLREVPLALAHGPI